MCLFTHIYTLMGSQFCKTHYLSLQFYFRVSQVWRGGIEGTPGPLSTSSTGSSPPSSWPRDWVSLSICPVSTVRGWILFWLPGCSSEALEHFPPLNISSFGAGLAQTRQQTRNPTARTTWLSTWPLVEPRALPPFTLSQPKRILNFRSPSRCAVNWTLGHFDASLPQPWYPPPKWGSPLMTHPVVSGFFYALPSGPSPPQLPFLLLWIFQLSVVTFKIHLKFSGWNHPPSYDTSCFCRSGIWAVFGWTRLLLRTVSTGAILVVFS